ncbi:MAG: response regulator, partial [Bacteroidales bacterium]|nr:response regulator [Bacteroidales bacterium]
LAITKQLVELQNGKIKVESEKFEGSCFIFTIPYDKKESPENKIESIDLKPIVEKKVLIVDDNSMNLLFTKSLLDKNGFETVTCKNGLEALEKIKSNKFDVVLMDLHMPKMDGYETSRQIRLMEAGSNEKIPIIALTAAATLNEIKKCFDSGMNDYLVKPFKKEELFSKLLSLLLNKPIRKND